MVQGEGGPGYCDDEKKYRGQKGRKQSPGPGSKQNLGEAELKRKQSSRENIADDSAGGIVEEEGGRSVVHNTEGDGLATGIVSSNHGKRRFSVSKEYSKQGGSDYPKLQVVSGADKLSCTGVGRGS
ncbi:unnamed protein product [Ectocarpus sp. CCAP 1310/34]|nr:unnamed protein product [Ectocarpus sp. CCAP 1310/34]